MKIVILFLTFVSATLSLHENNEVETEKYAKDDSVYDHILSINEKVFKSRLGSPKSKIYEGDIVMTGDLEKYLAGRPKRKLFRNVVKRKRNEFEETFNDNEHSFKKNPKDDSVFDKILEINMKANSQLHGSESLGNRYQGDIMVTDHFKAIMSNLRKRGVQNNPAKLWPLVNGYREVPFAIDSSIDDMTSAIYKAMEEWEREVPCFRFVQRTDQKDYIYFYSGEGCASPLGREGGRQLVSLGDEECAEHGTILHEIGHSLGFWHEQSRPDRDEYINIIWKNIAPDMRFNFDKQFAINSLGVPYDYDSIMHYGPYAFSIDPDHLVTIETKHGQPVGHRHHLSKSDILQAKLLYDCLEKPRPPMAASAGSSD